MKGVKQLLKWITVRKGLWGKSLDVSKLVDLLKRNMRLVFTPIQSNVKLLIIDFETVNDPIGSKKKLDTYLFI